jgi:hypothetical protein
MMLPAEIQSLLETGKRKILVLQWAGTLSLGLLGPGLLLLLLLPSLPWEWNRVPGLVIGAVVTVLFAAGLVETLRLSSTYQQIDRLLQEAPQGAAPNRVARVELDLKPFRTVVLPKVRLYLDSQRNAPYPMDLDSARRVMAYFKQESV